MNKSFITHLPFLTVIRRIHTKEATFKSDLKYNIRKKNSDIQ